MPRPKLEPLDIKCTDTDCEHGYHCFRSTKEMAERNESGRCRDCGADLVNWPRFHQQDLQDVDYTIQALEYELIRHHFWHVSIDERAIYYARRKGWLKMKPAVEHRIRKSVGVQTAFDGRQTPKSGNPIFYAQHATATCCRKCIEEWYGIPQDQPLNDDQVAYMSELCMMYLKQRLPTLTEYGERVPPIRKPKSG
jgi:hypothetical protein